MLSFTLATLSALMIFAVSLLGALLMFICLVAFCVIRSEWMRHTLRSERAAWRTLDVFMRALPFIIGSSVTTIYLAIWLGLA